MVRLGSAAGNTWGIGPDAVELVRRPVPPRPVRVPALPRPVVLDAARTAVAVIDMQNDFCAEGGWLHHIGVDVAPARRPIPVLARVLPVLRARGVPVLWISWGNRPDRLNLSPALLHVYDPTGQGVGLGGRVPGGDAGPASDAVLQHGSWGAAIVDGLQPGPADIRIDKTRMSGFWDTPLDSILRNLRIDTLLLGGVNADQCVLATLMDANFLGYDTALLEDCTATTSPDFCWQATLYNVRQCFGFTLLGADLAASLGQDATETTG